jgi:hypothetical protein
VKRTFALEMTGAATGIAGAFCMALLTTPAAGFALFLVSNLAWLAFAHAGRLWGLLVQQALFLLSSMLGLWNWWLGPLVLG